jgi:gamma-glutamylputrescine oxidase
MDENVSPTAYGDTWYAATKVEAPERPTLNIDLDVDVCVIGGGLAGLTTAREIARGGWSVVLVEASRLAANASGRNTGFVLPGFAAAPETIVGRVGLARARNLWALSQSGLDYVRAAITADAMPGIDPQDGWLHVSKTNDGDELLKQVGLLGEFGAEIEGWPAEQVRATLRSERYFHAIHFPRAINVHPLNYALGLAAAAERDGARIFENTPALSIDPAGVRKRIVTPNARLRANHVVLCGNLQIGKPMPPIGAALVPVTTYVITSAPLGAALVETIGYRGSVSDSDGADNHYRIVGGDRLMWSGRVTAWAGNPRRYVRKLTADIRRTYPQLGEIAVDYKWSGTMGHSIHRMPQIGELAPGVWLASGFGGHGLNTTAMAGNLIARAIVHGDQTWRQFTPFELVWAGGVSGRAITQVNYWVSRLRARLAERRARAADLASRAREQGSSETEPAPAQQAQPSMLEDEERAVVAAKSELPSSDDAAVALQTETSERAGLTESNVAEGQIKGELPPAPGPGKKRRRRKGRNKAQA